MKCSSRYYAYKMLLISLVFSLYCVGTTYAGKIRKDNSPLKNVTIHNEKITYDTRLVNIYARVMRYQTAAEDFNNYLNGYKANPSDYLSVGVSKMQYGELSELKNEIYKVYNHKYNNMYLEIMKDEICSNENICHVMYNAKWIKNEITLTIPNLDNVVEYLTYDAKIQFQGKTIKYFGIVLYYQYSGKELDQYIIDPIIPDINIIADEEMPPVVSPWTSYYGSYKYNAVNNLIKDMMSKGISLIPKDAPIGYLPGDDIGDEIMTLTLAVPTQCEYCDASGYIANKNVCEACTPAGNVCDGQGNCVDKYGVISQISNQITEVSLVDQSIIIPCHSYYPDYCGPDSNGWAINELNANCDGLDIVGGVFSENNYGLSTNCLGTLTPPDNSLQCSVNIAPNKLSDCTDTYYYCIPCTQVPQNGCGLSYGQQYEYLGYPIQSNHSPSYTFSKSGSGTFNRQ